MDMLNILAVVASALIMLAVVELIRRGRLKERYSLLWLLSSAVLIVLSFARGPLEWMSRLFGIVYPPSFLFLLAFAFLLLITMHFSVVLSSLSEKNKQLAQEIALLRRMLEEQKAPGAGKPAAPAAQ